MSRIGPGAAQLIGRTLANDARSGRLWLPPAFFVAVALLVPFAIGADRVRLASVGTGVAWLAALLAALLPAESLWRDERGDGTLDQLAVRGVGEEALAAGRVVAAWISLAGPLAIALPLVGPLLALDPATVARLAMSLAAGTPGLAALAVMTGALTLGRGRAGGLTATVMLPLAVPLLVFGAGAAGGKPGGLALTGACSLVLLAIAPFATGAALRASRA